MADMFAPLVAQLKANPKTIVFTEGNDPRILEAASKLLAEGVLKVVMVGNEAECKAAAAAGNFDISAAEIIDPENYAGFDEMVNTMVELRKGKQTAEECTALLKKSNYFGTMLVKMGKADCLLGGATYSTADTVRPALQIIKTKPGSKIVSSCFIMVRPSATGENEVLAMADCAINIKPTEDELVEIAVETARTAKVFGIDPKVAFLSYSTLGSGKGEDVDKMRNALLIAMEYNALLPALETPAHTEGYEGFFHLQEMHGKAEKATMEYIVRDHDMKRFQERKAMMDKAAEQINRRWGDGTAVVDTHDQYYNMYEVLKDHMEILELAESAMKAAGIEHPTHSPIRGGTDGSVLTYKGLLCPNLPSAGHNAHGRYEYAPVELSLIHI